jgi:hypothetical protein
MEIRDLIALFDVEADALNLSLRGHPALRPFFSRERTESVAELRQTYLRFLKMEADYARYSIPLLHASSRALARGDAEDREWSEFLTGYATDETDLEKAVTHDEWAIADMRALGASEAQVTAPPHPSALVYAKWFIEEAHLRPYAALGLKGVLEHLAIRVCDDMVQGILESGIENAANAVSFLHQHGTIDIGHVRAGDRNLERLGDPAKRLQVLQGAYLTSGSFRAFLRFCL